MSKLNFCGNVYFLVVVLMCSAIIGCPPGGGGSNTEGEEEGEGEGELTAEGEEDGAGGYQASFSCHNATATIEDGERITLCCSQGKTGYVYEGKLLYKEEEIDFSNIRMPHTEVKMILADPENAFQLSGHPAYRLPPPWQYHCHGMRVR